MPRQNRVTPLGAVVAIVERGTLVGNRGVLHDRAGTIRRAWQVRRWILCVLEFKERKRAVMQHGRYTELCFLDEATGLAGHRTGRVPSVSGSGSTSSAPRGSRAIVTLLATTRR